MGNGLISIIVPMYNVEQYIEECLESILRQTYKNIEIVLIDDGSIDGTANKIREYLEKYSNIKYVYQKNQGVSVARNRGIVESEGEFIMFVDGDDKVSTNICEKLISKNNDVVLCRYEKFPVLEKNRLNYFVLEDINSIDGLSRKHIRFMYENILFNPPVCKLYRKDLINICFDNTLSIGEDIVFNFKYLKNCKTISFVNESLYFYRQGNGESLSNRYDENRLDMVYRVYQETSNDSREIFGDKYEEDMFKTTFLREAMLSIKKMLFSDKLSYKEKIELLIQWKTSYNFKSFITEDWKTQRIGYKVFYYLYEKSYYNFLCTICVIMSKLKG